MDLWFQDLVPWQRDKMSRIVPEGSLSLEPYLRVSVMKRCQPIPCPYADMFSSYINILPLIFSSVKPAKHWCNKEENQAPIPLSYMHLSCHLEPHRHETESQGFPPERKKVNYCCIASALPLDTPHNHQQ